MRCFGRDGLSFSTTGGSSHTMEKRRRGRERIRVGEEERERGKEGERGGGGGGGGGADKTDSFHWHGEPDVVQAYSYRVTLLYGNAVGVTILQVVE